MLFEAFTYQPFHSTKHTKWAIKLLGHSFDISFCLGKHNQVVDILSKPLESLSLVVHHILPYCPIVAISCTTRSTVKFRVAGVVGMAENGTHGILLWLRESESCLIENLAVQRSYEKLFTLWLA
ncbi:hypothetical protein VNO78_23941 [Psophocarpus tetragonolobus]|uniref:Uncharacterized protein n=1 Tax=Psophocarpus tetragonolobus TaxID=3891 RepID=A0AAN9S7M3_PSOTE